MFDMDGPAAGKQAFAVFLREPAQIDIVTIGQAFIALESLEIIIKKQDFYMVGDNNIDLLYPVWFPYLFCLPVQSERRKLFKESQGKSRTGSNVY